MEKSGFSAGKKEVFNKKLLSDAIVSALFLLADEQVRIALTGDVVTMAPLTAIALSLPDEPLPTLWTYQHRALPFRPIIVTNARSAVQIE